MARSSWSDVAAVLLLATAGAVGCAAPPVVEPHDGPSRPPPITDVERYMPLIHDTVYAYDTLDDTGQPGLLVMQVTRPRQGRVDLKVGNQIQRLELVPDGIRRVGGGYLLRSPLELGARWKDGPSRIVVTVVDKTVKVEAGEFVGCVETVEESGVAGSGKKVTSTYCPEVGMVLMQVEAMTDAEFASITAELKSFGPRVDIGAVPE